MAQKTGLGKGLEALIPGSWDKKSPSAEITSIGSGESVRMVPVGNISPNPHQPRHVFDQDALEELASSIREHGVISPLIVVTTASPDHFVLIAGERRLRAAKLAGLKEVPAIIRTSNAQEQLELAIIENVQREDLDPLERAKAYQALLDEFSLTHEDIARRVGKNRVTVTNSLRLLNLPEEVQKALSQHQISEGHARAILALPTVKAMELACQTVISQNLNVRQTEQLISRLSGKTNKPAAQKDNRSAADRDLENQLREHFNTRVSLNKGPKGGNLSIYFYSDEELNNILDKLRLYD